jgi:hypothetical protein
MPEGKKQPCSSINHLLYERKQTKEMASYKTIIFLATVKLAGYAK